MIRHPLPVLLGLALPAAAADDWAPPQAPQSVAVDHFKHDPGLEVTVWASTPMLFNPTNMDIDHNGRIWVAEGVNYRRHKGRRPDGDRIVVLQDTDGDGKADASHTFVQEKALIAPLGVAVFDNVIYVSQPPDLIVYTDVNRDLRFDPAVDKREVLLTGFNAVNHDHSLHSVTAGPDGKFYFNNGNCGAVFTDRSGKTFYLGGPYRSGGGKLAADTKAAAGRRSDDGHVWTPGFTVRMNPDGTNAEIVGHGYRNSYEQTLTSVGDMFQNDNDDPPACRVSYVLEYGCAGYFTRDSRQFYRSVRRPGQEHARAHWRQDDPGTMDAGDIYGGGSPTGVTFYENGALGEKWNGSLFTCEPGRNTIFHYMPEPRGAAFALERGTLLSTNTSGRFYGSDFVGGRPSREEPFFFRPSDICVGPDGAVYITDWFDARVGGHADLDGSCSGTIYRLAPKGFTPRIPKLALDTTAGQIAALKSPAINTRYLGFRRLKNQGAGAFEPVAALLDDPNPWIAARAVWLLPHLGAEGVRKCEGYLQDPDAGKRLLAFRALRRAGRNILPHARSLAKDPSPQVRRDVALALRDHPAARTKAIFVELARRCDPADKNAVEAIGLGAANQESEIWLALKEALAPGAPTKWPPQFARLTWRLWPAAAAGDLQARAMSDSLPSEARKFAVESLAFIDDRKAVDALLALASRPSPVKADAAAWLLRNGTGEWAKYDLKAELKAKGIYDPDTITVTPVTVPEPPKTSKLPPLGEILAMKGDAERGKATALRCTVCHQINGIGPDYGPNLKGWGKGQTLDVIARSIVDPSADIAHGFRGTGVALKDGGAIHGIAFNDGDPLIIQSTGGITQMVPGNRIKKKWKLKHSLMLSADQLGLTAQDVADLVAWLRVYE
ncbi:MAG: c-type cytochrome [Akkermansiaceae bacterium]|nr:c-type cytochrome [Akkermansiaceae bacterium]NNM29946.1 c-type cytochrome [Akkermansiaceae bacterium]